MERPVLVPNTELGHLEIRGKDGESRAAASVRERKSLSWQVLGPAVPYQYIHRVDALFWPDLIILGGGVSKRAEKFTSFLTARPRLVVATLHNEAGIVRRRGARGGVAAADAGPEAAHDPGRRPDPCQRVSGAASGHVGALQVRHEGVDAEPPARRLAHELWGRVADRAVRARARAPA